jgi:predicted nucleic acid-binding protein
VDTVTKTTYIDSGVLINAFRGESALGLRAINILDDSDRSFASSIFVQLETLPKAIYQRQQIEQDFYQAFFSIVSHWAIDLPIIIPNAQTIASRYGIAGMDAIHIAAAIAIGVEEFITTEKPTKPMFRVTELKITSIAN